MRGTSLVDNFNAKRLSEVMEMNPYAAPQSQVLQATSLDVLTREEHIKTEASIKSIGLLYYLATLVLIAVGASFLTSGKGSSLSLLPGGLCLLISIGAGVTGYGLRRLRKWARIPTIILSSIAVIYGLINLSGGIIIHIFILVKMLGKQGQFVMTPEYQEIIAATPHVKNKTSIVVKVLLVLLLIILVGIIAAIKFGQ